MLKPNDVGNRLDHATFLHSVYSNINHFKDKMHTGILVSWGYKNIKPCITQTKLPCDSKW